MSTMPLNVVNPLDNQVDMTSSAKEAVASQNEQAKPTAQEQVDKKVKQRNSDFRTRIDSCKLYRRKLIANWTISIDYRRGKPFPSQTDEDQIAVNLDWSLTKTKVAELFSQIPQVRVSHPPQTLDPKVSPWLKNFEQKLNDTLVLAGIEACMEEVLPDCINAAGIGVAIVSYEAITQTTQVPKIDPSMLTPEQQKELQSSQTVDGQPVEMEEVPKVVDKRYLIERVSPADFLWPINSTVSNFDRAPWIGRSGRITWADAVKRFNLKEEDKESVLGEDRPMMDKLTHDVERDKTSADDMVGFDEVFYWEHQYDDEATSYQTIHHLVFIAGKDDPVIDEPWKGQEVDEGSGTVLGSRKFPIRVLTLAYVTDESIPPSDSAIGRPQVNEINKARSQMIRQRERSLPVRWFDVNRVDPTIQQGLMRGTWQAMIPVQGSGERVIGEVARATMPQENFMFDKIAKFDLNELWTVMGPGPDEKPGEPQVGQPQSSFQTKLGRERAKVASFFVGIAEVLAGLMCLYEDPQAIGEGFDKTISTTLNYSILADSTVLVDANQRLARLNQFINMYAKSGFVNVEPVLQEIATLTGLDPNVVIKKPEPKPPVEPNISLRLTGVEDMLNPLTLAFLIKSGQAPPPELIEQAKQLIQQAVVPPQPPPGQDPGSMGPGGPMPPPGGPAPSGPPLLPPSPGPHPGSPTPPPSPPKMGEAHPNWAVMPQINKRSEEGGKQ